MGLEVQANQYLDNRPVMNCSDVTAADVDQEVMQVLKDSYEEAKRLLTEHRTTLDKIAEFLIEKETITGKEFMEIFREVEGIHETEGKTSASRISERVQENLSDDSAKMVEPNTVIELPGAVETDAEAVQAKEPETATEASQAEQPEAVKTEGAEAEKMP